MTAASDTDTKTASQSDYEAPEWLSLDDDEHIEWLGEPVMLSVISTVVWGIVLIPFFGIGFLLLLGAPFSYLSIEKTDFVVTNKSLYVKKGIFSTNIENVGLDKIQNTEYSQSFFGKQLGYGNIDISTAGSSGAEITFRAIEDARDVREDITRLANEYQDSRSRSSGSTDGDATADRAGAVDDQLDAILTELKGTRETMENVERLLRDEHGIDPDAVDVATDSETGDSDAEDSDAVAAPVDDDTTTESGDDDTVDTADTADSDAE